MKATELKIISIVLGIALMFTVFSSNALSVISMLYSIKNMNSAPAPEVQQGVAPQGNNSGNASSGSNMGNAANNAGNTSAGTSSSTGTNAGTGNGTGANTGTTVQNNSNNTATDNKGNGTEGTANDNTNNKMDSAEKSAQEILEIYTRVMNKAKADKPGYTKIEYQELPSDANNRVISKGSGLVGVLLNLVDSLELMKSKEAAEADPEIVEKGSDMRWFPVYKCEKGCYLTDVSAIESATYEDLGDGKAKITIEINDESNPEPMAEGASTSPSNTGAMFSPLSKAEIDTTLNGGAVSAVIKNVTYNLVYHDCKVVLVYDTKTDEIITLEQYMNVAIQGSGNVVLMGDIQIDKQELFNTMYIKDFQY